MYFELSQVNGQFLNEFHIQHVWAAFVVSRMLYTESLVTATIYFPSLFSHLKSCLNQLSFKHCI